MNLLALLLAKLDVVVDEPTKTQVANELRAEAEAAHIAAHLTACSRCFGASADTGRGSRICLTCGHVWPTNTKETNR